MMATLIALMKLSSKYMEKSEVKLCDFHTNYYLKRSGKQVSWIIEYSLCNPTSTITHTTGNALASRYSTIEVEVKSEKLCSYICISIHMHRYRLVIRFPRLCLDFRLWASATEMVGEYMTFKPAEDMLKHNFLSCMLCSLICLLFLPIVSNGCILPKVRFVCLPSLNHVTGNAKCNIPERYLCTAVAYTAHFNI